MPDSQSQLRRYIIYFYEERSDESVDSEIDIYAYSIEKAIEQFKTKISVYRRIYAIYEK